MSTNLCRICGSPTRVYDQISNAAVEVSRLYPKPTENSGVKIELSNCSVCGHFQIPYLNIEQYYEDYVMAVGHIQKQQDLHKRQVQELSQLAPSTERFIEVGCGDGVFLTQANSKFRHVTGIEPSQAFYDLCKQKGLDVVHAYLNKDTHFDVRFDAFASRQVFEHVEHPVEMLSSLRRFLSKDAVGLIEVPNAQKMILENRYFDLFTDHINYYTPQSLCRLATTSGFAVVTVRESFNGDYLELWAKNKVKTENLSEKRDHDLAFISQHVANYATYSIWGAGAKTQSILTAAGKKLHPKFIFDSDKYKQSKFTINSQTPVTAPEADRILQNDLIIIGAVSYQDEIIKLLQAMNYTGDVLCLEGTPQISHLKNLSVASGVPS